MAANICVFEDNGFKNLLPLVFSRGVFELHCGIGSLLGKIIRAYPKVSVSLMARDYLADVIGERLPYKINSKAAKAEDCLFINGRLLLDESIPIKGEEEIGLAGDTVVYVRLLKDKAALLRNEDFLNGNVTAKLKNKVRIKKVKDAIINYPWDLVNYNEAQITKDFKTMIKNPRIEGKIYPGVYLVNKPQIHIAEGVTVKPGAVLDAQKGPIYIDREAEIFPNVSIEGPVFIGRGSKIKAGARIYSGTSIGEICRVGGEVGESIIHSHSNKQHDGFLGHAYVGMWVNLGADTNNSDLKNNYSPVQVSLDGEEEIDTKSIFAGVFMADHAKSAIGTMFNTGTVVGFSSNVFGRGPVPKFVPSFAWGQGNEASTYVLEKAIATARIAMSRRSIKMSPAQEKLFKTIFSLTNLKRKKTA
jgi:UDP-N-acetylglucosamine diphosphorylase / glucose-1-phosphate thymidylyltransferase / UDP-N-acetylgalactosamine diphosphorylase / glucosamine-1-phosphate N-acetyltransferase / galactosamine-1-phosphate N-acetyltransferase